MLRHPAEVVCAALSEGNAHPATDRIVANCLDRRGADADHLHDQRLHFFLDWAKADPAADFDAAPVLPLRNTAEAALAARADVTLGGETCDSELPAAVFDVLPVEDLERTAEDFEATPLLVTLVAMSDS